ncbi:MAG: putative quinol monooxygenase [Acidimicrobiia bacterium]
MAEDVELSIVAGSFSARSGREADLAAVLAKYVVVTRNAPGCRNVDLAASITTPGRFLVVEKWDDADAQAAHLDSDEMVEMAKAASGMLTGPPDLDLFAAISAHDLH